MIASAADFVRQTFRRNLLLAAVAAAHLALFAVLMVLSLLDSAEILGINRWIKPMKFAISIALFLGTMGWLLSYVRDSSPRAVGTLSWIMTVTLCGEMSLIAMQSARGVQSHFNNATVLDGVVFSAMGILIVVNTLAVTYTLYLFFRRPVTASGAHLAGIRLGTLLFVLASLEAVLMVTGNAHSVGVRDGGPGLPFVNWSTSGGDLRVAHFVGMHALQGLPLLGWLLDRRQASAGTRLVGVVALIWLIVTALLVTQALAGRPLLTL